jgi:hypothetical protein
VDFKTAWNCLEDLGVSLPATKVNRLRLDAQAADVQQGLGLPGIGSLWYDPKDDQFTLIRSRATVYPEQEAMKKVLELCR